MNTETNSNVVIDFAGGLGDFIRQCYTTNSYTVASSAKGKVDILLGSHNPYAFEVFTHHKNRANFRLHHLSHKYDEFFHAGFRGHDIIVKLYEFVGLKIDDRVLSASTASPTFYAFDDVQPSGPYVVIQPYAGCSSKSAPGALVTEIVQLLLEHKIEVHIVTRGYSRASPSGKLIHAKEEIAEAWRDLGILIHDSLSVPATLNLVAKASMVVSTHSALLQAAWFENVPTCALYPSGYPDWHPDNLGRDYTWGARKPNCFHASFDSFNASNFVSFMQTHLKVIDDPSSQTLPLERDETSIELFCRKLLMDAEPMSQNVVPPGNIGFGWIYYSMVRNLRPDVVVAIGSARGFMPISLARAIRDNGSGEVLFIDPSYRGNGHPGWSGRGHWDNPLDVDKWFHAFGVNGTIKHLKMESDLALPSVQKLLNGRTCNLVVIDGAHTHEQSLKDFENYAQFVRDGFVLFHDSINPACQVDRTIDELRRRGYRFVTLAKDAGLTLVEVRGSKSGSYSWEYMNEKSDRHDWIYGILKNAAPQAGLILEAYCGRTFLPDYFPSAKIVGWDCHSAVIESLRTIYPHAIWQELGENSVIEGLAGVKADVVVACGMTSPHAAWDPQHGLDILKFLVATRRPKCCLVEGPAEYHDDPLLELMAVFLGQLGYKVTAHEKATSMARFHKRKLILGTL